MGAWNATVPRPWQRKGLDAVRSWGFRNAGVPKWRTVSFPGRSRLAALGMPRADPPRGAFQRKLQV